MNVFPLAATATKPGKDRGKMYEQIEWSRRRGRQMEKRVCYSLEFIQFCFHRRRIAASAKGKAHILKASPRTPHRRLVFIAAHTSRKRN